MALFPEIYVLRHGQTVWNAQARFQGVLNSPLDATGLSHAQAQHDIMARQNLTGFSVFCSPQGRAVQTAGIALAPLVDRIETDARLAEIDVGRWSGLLRSEVSIGQDVVETPDGSLEHYERAPGGEGFAKLEIRCRSFLEDLEGPAILMTHGITSRMLRAIWLGLGADGLSQMPGGQGVAFHLKDNKQHIMTA